MKTVDDDHCLLLERHIDEDTRMLRADYFLVGDMPLLVENWTWEGISGSTAVPCC